jgi:hypothetical protein
MNHFIMKKIVFLIALSFVFFSCDVSEEQNYTYEINPVYQVIMPTEFAKDSVTNITVKYKRPSSCHLFSKFYYESYGFERKVAIENIKVEQDNCQTDNETVLEMPLKFLPNAIGTYHFKFWTGTDTQGVDHYLEYDVVVDH